MIPAILSVPNNVTSKAKRDLRRIEKQAKGSTLSEQLIACLHKSNFHDPEQEYYPIGCVRRIITQDTIEKEFRKCNEAASALDEEEDKYAIIHWIYLQAYKTFATAVVCGLESLDLLDFMLEYQERHLTDSNLSSVSEESICECIDNVTKAHNFCIQRWKFLAPIFSPSEYEYNLPKDCIFPFAKDTTISRSGAFGTVSRVEIHKDHQFHVNMQYVAIKEIQIPQDKKTVATNKAWENEAKILRKINNFDHPNITKCIAAIRRGERRYFMFAWAGGSNLQEYWKQTAHHSPDARLIKQAINQLRGLADALDTLHSYGNNKYNRPTVPNIQGGGGGDTNEDDGKSIRHGDLKPENILRFMEAPESQVPHLKKELGVLKIADMGLAKQHTGATQLRANTSQRYGTIRYEAPEAITETKGRSRLYDMWSMGCITLEFIIWILHGNNVLEEFYAQVEVGREQACQYFELRDDGKRIEIHRVVSDWMDSIRRSDPECSQDTAIRDLLNLVSNRLLVVKLDPNPRRCLFSAQFEAKERTSLFRATASEFRDSLDIILEKSKSEPTYLCTGKGRDDIQLPVRRGGLPQATAAQ